MFIYTPMHHVTISLMILLTIIWLLWQEMISLIHSAELEDADTLTALAGARLGLRSWMLSLLLLTPNMRELLRLCDSVKLHLCLEPGLTWWIPDSEVFITREDLGEKSEITHRHDSPAAASSGERTTCFSGAKTTSVKSLVKTVNLRAGHRTSFLHFFLPQEFTSPHYSRLKVSFISVSSRLKANFALTSR